MRVCLVSKGSNYQPEAHTAEREIIPELDPNLILIGGQHFGARQGRCTDHATPGSDWCLTLTRTLTLIGSDWHLCP